MNLAKNHDISHDTAPLSEQQTSMLAVLFSVPYCFSGVIIIQFIRKYVLAIFKTGNGESDNGEWGTGNGNGESLKWGIFKSGNL